MEVHGLRAPPPCMALHCPHHAFAGISYKVQTHLVPLLAPLCQSPPPSPGRAWPPPPTPNPCLPRPLGECKKHFGGLELLCPVDPAYSLQLPVLSLKVRQGEPSPGGTDGAATAGLEVGRHPDSAPGSRRLTQRESQCLRVARAQELRHVPMFSPEARLDKTHPKYLKRQVTLRPVHKQQPQSSRWVAHVFQEIFSDI